MGTDQSIDSFKNFHDGDQSDRVKKGMDDDADLCVPEAMDVADPSHSEEKVVSGSDIQHVPEAIAEIVDAGQHVLEAADVANPSNSEEKVVSGSDIQRVPEAIAEIVDAGKHVPEAVNVADLSNPTTLDPRFPTMPAEQFVYIPARGNGSCGPNSLAIIFCSYLLLGLYSEPHREKYINLVQFATCWNLYYARNTATDSDYINIPEYTGTPEQEQLLELNQSIYEKVKSRLHAYASKYNGNSFKQCEALIAPILRFAYNLNNELDADTRFRYLQPYFSSALLRAQSKDVSPEYDTGLYECVMGLSDQVKRDMSLEKMVKRVLHVGEMTTDNSPSYRSYFDTIGNTFVADLLGLVLRYAEKKSNEFKWAIEPGGEFKFDTTVRETWYDEHGPQLKAIIFHKDKHFDACLPRPVCAHEYVHPFYVDSSENHSRQAGWPADSEVYNPAKISSSDRFPQDRKPSNIRSKCQDDTSFSYRFLTYSSYFTLAALMVIASYYAPLASLLVLSVLGSAYILRERIAGIMSQRHEFSVAKPQGHAMLPSESVAKKQDLCSHAFFWPRAFPKVFAAQNFRPM